MIERIIEPRVAALVEGISVKRILPRGGRGVGPFIFLDHMGPWDYQPGKNSVDVAPHPHIGLSTLTYLFEGELYHRDSLGSRQVVTPGDVNWMTAGNGIAHSERVSPEFKDKPQTIHGLQAWVSLPNEVEDMDPSFAHHGKASLPRFSLGGVDFTLIAGSAFGKRSPVKTHSRLFYLETKFRAGAEIKFDPEGQEIAFYFMDGRIEVMNQIIDGPKILIFKQGEQISFRALDEVHGVLLGGDSLGPKKIWWNFVSSTQEKIDAAKSRWLEQKFPKVPEEDEFIPLPS
ncbi:MAG: pirin family protein [Bdellovibrionia bacterium]